MTHKIKVYKLQGESSTISESPVVFSTYEMAAEAIKGWEDYLGMSSEEALELEEVRIKEWYLYHD